MRGSEDPAAPASLRAAARPPDPGDPRQDEEDRMTAETSAVVPMPATSEQAAVQTSEGHTSEDQDADMPLSSPDSIVAETQTSQALEEELEDGPDNDGSPDKARVDSINQGEGQQGQAANVAESDSKKTTEGRQLQEEEQQDVQPAEMFAAVVAAMQAAPAMRPREEWITTIAALYAAAHVTVAIDEERVPAAKRRYPKLKGEERALLTTFFKEAFVVSKGTFADWTRYATTATRDLYNTSWPMKTILERLIGRVKWAREQPMNLWTAKVKAGTTDEITQNGTVKQYQTYMFNPARFSKEDIGKLMKLCEQPAATAHGRALREGSNDEWRILEAMATGNIVCRRVPAFVKSVLDSKEITRLNRTIQLQLEGELVLQLRGRGSVPASRRSTRAIKDDIMLAAVKAGVNLDEVQGMLNKTKTISYNPAQRSIHFFYFDRATARKYQLMCIPFQRQIHALVNVHGPDTGSVWDRQLARDGTRPSATTEYAVVIHNITRFTDIGRLTAYLEQHIPTAFDLEDLDTCTPDSRTSTDWRLTLKSMECPDFLREVVRIVGFGRPLIVQHPAVGYRFQCLRCGNIGLPMARCSYTDRQLAGPGSRVAVDRDVAKLEDLTKPFTSFAEMQVTAQKRLTTQEAVGRKAAEAVRPDKPQGTSQEEKQSSKTPSAGERQHQQRSNIPAARVIAPAPKNNRVTLLQRNGTRIHAHEDTFRERFQVQPSRFAELDDSNSADEDREEKTEDNPPEHETIELSSGDERETSHQPKITAEEKAQLHLVKDKPPKLIPTPQLVALKQRERIALTQAIQQLQPHRGQPVNMTDQSLGTVTDAVELESRLGLRSVATPASGNCMAMALAQAVTDQALAEPAGELERITAIIKRGVGWSGQINFLEQFDHFTRKMTLINVERGWETMDAHESSKQFRWYLHDYATSSSDPEVFIPRHSWGSSEMMALAASFMQRKIFVMAYDVHHSKQWQCCMYKPGSGSKGRRIYEKGVQVSLQPDRWMTEVLKEKAAGKAMPLVVRYWGEHYSAYVHTQQQAELVAGDEEQQAVNMEVDEQSGAGFKQQPVNDHATEEMQQESHGIRLCGMAILRSSAAD